MSNAQVSAARQNYKPPVLTIAGSDNSAGAGIQADLKTFSYFGCYGLTAVTCVVAEVPGHVRSVHPIPTAILADQLHILRETFPLRAIKTGMLYSKALIQQTASCLHDLKCPIVVDPVMIATSGQPLLKPDAISAYWKKIFPLASLITPNLNELASLTGLTISSPADLQDAGKKLADLTQCPVLAKGGHLQSKLATDFLIHSKGIDRFDAPKISAAASHGTGCTYSAAIAAQLALGHPLTAAVRIAKDYITETLALSLSWKSGRIKALEHFPSHALPKTPHPFPSSKFSPAKSHSSEPPSSPKTITPTSYHHPPLPHKNQ